MPNVPPMFFLIAFLVILAGFICIWLRFGRSVGMSPREIFAVPSAEEENGNGDSVSGPHFDEPPPSDDKQFVIRKGTTVRYRKGRHGSGRAVIDGFRWNGKRGLWFARMTNSAGQPLSRPVAELLPPK